MEEPRGLSGQSTQGTFAMISTKGSHSMVFAVTAFTLLGCSSNSTETGGAAKDVQQRAQGCRPTPTITSPESGATLNGSVQTFTWTGQADEYQLDIGTGPRRRDVYESGPLAGVTSLQVSGLPLNAAPLYVELRSRCGGGSYSESTNQYVAAVRRGLAIVVDFADFRLEDWQEPPGSTLPPGFHGMEDVRAVLDQMTDHWEWLSRGTEKMVWDLTRVQLPVNLTENAYPHYAQFRRAVVDLANVDPVAYDQNGDGILEGIWMVVASAYHQGGDPGYDFLSGGSGQVDNVKSFVDGQGSYAVRFRRYGAFNHEFAHAIALPDLYGQYSTVYGLSLMASGVENIPADDLCAWGRQQLGWLKPTVVTRSRHHLVVPSANDQLAAIEVPTIRPYEYFLIEYRKTPGAGFGSKAPPYDGLAVYHVFMPSVQNMDPPLLKLEPAGAPMLPNTPADPEDLFYPENTTMTLPAVMRSYVTNEAVFEIDRVRRAHRGMAVDIQILGDGGTTSTNLVQNASLEQGSGSPDFWSTGGGDATFEWSSIVAHTGTHSVSVSSSEPVDAEWHQRIDGLDPAQGYLLCGWIRGEGITRYETMRAGGTVALSGSFEQTGPLDASFDWTERCIEFEAETSSQTIACRLGGYSSTAAGTVRCDDFSVFPLRSAFVF